ncbi:transcription-repair coupling factor [Schleiferiaceae bacterium]|nr:transcription-repair coupling factor [Schleiferiaceae bacterium]
MRALLDAYRADARLHALLRAWSAPPADSPVGLSGVRGSLKAVIAALAWEALQRPMILVRSDKEDAAYFLNDLEKLLGPGKAFFFPDSYRKPYADRDQVDNANIGLRAEALERLQRERCIIVTYPEALAEKVVTRKSFGSKSLRVAKGDKLDLDFFNESLFDMRFERVDFVEKPGQFAVRGGIVDVFSFAHAQPHRIEFFGNEVDNIRSFEVDSQLSDGRVEAMTLVPNVEDKVRKEIRESLIEYAGEDALLWIEDAAFLQEKLDQGYALAEAAYVAFEGGIRPMEPHALYSSGSHLVQLLQHKTYLSEGIATAQSAWQSLPQPAFGKNFTLLLEHLQAQQRVDRELWIMCSLAQQQKRLASIIHDLSGDESLPIHWVESALHAGWEDPQAGRVIYSDHEIFERYQRFRLRDGLDKAQAITLKELNALQVGDYVTHIDHGIGKFGGLQKIDVQGKIQEAIKLVYKDSDILYVSIHSLHKIAKFNGKEGATPVLNKLGSPAWQSLKKKTKTRVKQLAYDLIQLYAKRKEAKGFGFSPDSYLQHELEASFHYEDTPDQEKATADIKSDMENPIAMDRLICGDVGFGKTELAVRAAFKAVADSKQVAVLVPTTILAFQHFQTFSQRLEGFPARVEYINRSRSAKDVKAIAEGLANGSIDILIGTHKLVSKELQFKDLGLLIIDEEQKFGVNVKDKLKTLKVNVDTLTLTATPIPRTLQFSLMAARDLSVMTTPPPNRQPIETHVMGFNESGIRDALAYEMSRGGQAFFIHNRVENIQEVAGMIQRLIPDARIAIGHGQMKGQDLEKILLDFMAGSYDILVSTTIVESGLDVPNANTMIIHQAHMFGLSDLHQMRGRVGRSNRKAFCYLIAPPLAGLPEESRKRLQALEQFSDLGSGFKIALRDLEIRGAGDLLGAEQSGFINDLGFDTYQKLLSEAVDELKKNEFKELYADQRGGWDPSERECQLDTDLELLLPDAYINFVEERLRIYRELNDLKDEAALRTYIGGLEDRFGALPPQAERLMTSLRLRWLGQAMGFDKIVLKAGKLLCYFPEEAHDAPPQEVLVNFLSKLQSQPSRYRMKQKGPRISLVVENIPTVDQAFVTLNELRPEPHLEP